MFAIPQSRGGGASMDRSGFSEPGNYFQGNSGGRGADNFSPGRGQYQGGAVGPMQGYNYGPAQGPAANPFGGAAGFNNPNPPTTSQFFPQANGLQPTQQFNGNNWDPSFQQFSGYNPLQYATTETANTLAGAIGSGLGLGANVRMTQNAPGSPIGPPPQAMLDFGGADMLNAGLLAERYKKYDQATADAMTRAELAMMGPRQAPNADSQGGTMGSWSQYGGAPAGGSQNLGGGQNIGQFVGESYKAPAPSTAVAAPTPQAPSPTAPHTQGDTSHQVGYQPGPAAPISSVTPNIQGQFGGSGQTGWNSPVDLFNSMFGPNGQGLPRPQQTFTGGGLGQFSQFLQSGGQRQRPNPYGSFPGTMTGFANSMNSYQRPSYSPFGTPQLGSGRQFQNYTPATR